MTKNLFTLKFKVSIAIYCALLLILRYDYFSYSQASLRSATLTLVIFAAVCLIVYGLFQIFALRNITKKFVMFFTCTYLLFPFSIWDAYPHIYGQLPIKVAPSRYFGQSEFEVLGEPVLRYLPNSILAETFPLQHELLILSAILLLSSFLLKRKKIRRFDPSLFPQVLIVLIATMISLLHTGISSPYTTNDLYRAYSEQDTGWYVAYAKDSFSNQLIPVNGDYAFYVEVDKVAWGPNSNPSSQDPSPMLLHRAAPSFLFAPFTFYLGQYSFWIIFHIALLALAMRAMTGILSNFVKNKLASYMGSLLFGISLPMNLYFGTPTGYFSGLCLVVVTIWTFLQYLNQPTRARLAVFSGTYILAVLSYDLTPLGIALSIFAITGGARVIHGKPLVALAACMTPFLLPKLFVGIYTAMGGQVNTVNTNQIPELIAAAIVKAEGQSLYQLFTDFQIALFSGIRVLPLAFGAFTVLLVILGLLTLRNKNQAVFVSALLVPYFAVIGIFIYSESWLATIPRLFVGLYPAIFLLVAIAVEALFRNSIGKITALAIVVCIVIASSIDLFGFPAPYTLIQYGDYPQSLPWRDIFM